MGSHYDILGVSKDASKVCRFVADRKTSSIMFFSKFIVSSFAF